MVCVLRPIIAQNFEGPQGVFIRKAYVRALARKAGGGPSVAREAAMHQRGCKIRTDRQDDTNLAIVSRFL